MSRSGFTVRTALILLLAFAANSLAEYSGGTGEPNSPFEIGTVADWQELMDTPGDWDKYFVLTGDIDVNGVAMMPVGNDANNFTGIFDGNDHIIRNADMNTPDTDYVGLFGYIGPNGHIATLGAENVTIKGRNYVGGLAGYNDGGNIVLCYTTGSVGGVSNVGGLIGYDDEGIIIACYSAASVIGSGDSIGGLVGYTFSDTLNACFATGAVSGESNVGGLLGLSVGTLTACYATGAVIGDENVGGLIGYVASSVDFSYSTGLVSGNSDVGGLIGNAGFRWSGAYTCFWDKDTSRRTSSVGGEGKTTGEMQDPNTFLLAEWDFTDEDADPADWFMPEDDYPRLTCESWAWAQIPDITSMSWQDAMAAVSDAGFLVGSANWVVSQSVPVGDIISQYPPAGFTSVQGVAEIDLEISLPSGFSAGSGSQEDPYQISTANEWGLLIESPGLWGEHFILMSDIDFQGLPLSPVGSESDGFLGVLDGNTHIIRNVFMNMPDTDCVGLFGLLGSRVYPQEPEIYNLGLEDVSIIGGDYVGGLVGWDYRGSITDCYVTGSVSGNEYVGGLTGSGGVERSYAIVSVAGDRYVGGLAGVSVGISNSYAAGPVSGNSDVGGLVGYVDYAYTPACFWDIDVSGQVVSAGGMGRATAEIKDIQTYSNAGWDFTTKDHDPADWVMPENDYPHLAWEYRTQANIPDVNGMTFEAAATTVRAAGFLVGLISGVVSETVPLASVVQQTPLPDSNGIEGVTKVDMVISYRDEFRDGNGAEDDPYRIATVDDWILLTDREESMTEHFVLTADVDFYGGEMSPVGSCLGVFDGNGYVIRNVLVDKPEGHNVGLFCYLMPGGRIYDMGAEDVHIRSDRYNSTSVGGLVGQNWGSVTNCHASGWVEHGGMVGGLVGYNNGSITDCYAGGWVGNGDDVGGLVGDNRDSISASFATAGVGGSTRCGGGLVGSNDGSIADSYANGDVTGYTNSGGLVGQNSDDGSITACYATGWVADGMSVGGLVSRNYSGTSVACFWDEDASGTTTSAGGEGKTTGEMQDPNTFVSAGWDFVGESANGTEDIWSICEGTNYPRLVWEIPSADWVCPDGVGLEDFSHFGSLWGIGEGGAVNLDDEEGVGFGDLMIFCEQWLTGR